MHILYIIYLFCEIEEFSDMKKIFKLITNEI